MKLLALVVVVAFLGRVMALPGGAPVQACMTLTPQHGSNTPRPNPSSNTINIEAFEVEGSSNATADYVYIPGSSYTSKRGYVCTYNYVRAHGRMVER